MAVSRELPDCGKQRGSLENLEILEILEIPRVEKTPFRSNDPFFRSRRVPKSDFSGSQRKGGINRLKGEVKRGKGVREGRPEGGRGGGA